MEHQDAPAHPKMSAPFELLSLENQTWQVKSTVPINVPLFEANPAVIEFHDYEPFGTVDKVIKFRNNDHVARRIKVLQPASPHFKLIGPHMANKGPIKQSKVATGMEVCYTVRFEASEIKEYATELICVTEREKFALPLRARGIVPKLATDDSVDFGPRAVKATSIKPLLIRNLGTCAVAFRVSTSGTDAAFEAWPQQGFCDIGRLTTIELHFTPSRAGNYEGELVFQMTNWTECDAPPTYHHVALRALSVEVDVHLSTSAVSLDPAYVSLASRTSFTITNRAEIPVAYSWKQFGTVDEEEAERTRLSADLTHMQHLEEVHLEKQLSINYTNEDESATAAREALAVKYRHLKIALDNDDMMFADANFELTPQRGEIMAVDDLRMDVVFRPDTAAEYSSVAYLDIVGRQTRLPVWFGGLGIGPKATLAYDVLDVGNISIGAEYSYALNLSNKGDIPAVWRLVFEACPEDDADDGRGVDINKTSFVTPTTVFDFEPNAGKLEVGATQEITVRLRGVTLGEFSEVAKIEPEGSTTSLPCRFKGHVVGPTFHFDAEVIDLGLCSYSFDHERTLVLTNTSDIPMTYTLRIPQDARREFVVIPDRGTLEASDAIHIIVSFKPMAVRVYDYYLVVDVAGVGDALLTLPIAAECAVPDVRLRVEDGVDGANELSFGDRCYIRYPYERELLLVNTHDLLSARFEMSTQDPQTSMFGEFSCSPESSVVPPGSKRAINVTLRCNRLGHVRLGLTTTICGSAQPPLQTTLVAYARGPELSLSTKELYWGPTECLVDTSRTLTLQNEASIPAPLKLFLKNARSKFRVVDIREAVLAPHESIDLSIVACLDDTTLHKDQLHVVVAEGDNYMIPLSAKGVGTTMYSSQDLSLVDFGPQFTCTTFERKITLENKGRRSQVLKWVNETWQLQQLARGGSISGKEDRKKSVISSSTPSVAATDMMPVFAVLPEEIELRPRTAAVFTFRGCAPNKGVVEEKLVCETRVHKEKKARPVFHTIVRADVVEPAIDFSADELHYTFHWTSDESQSRQPLQRELTLKNTCVLPLAFQLRCGMPFSVDQWEHSLQPGDATTVLVDFDPWFKRDRISHRIDAKLVAAYHQHPQRDAVRMIGDVHFPNLEFETTTVNFGCVLNDTTLTHTVRVTNTSKVPASFRWAFLDDDSHYKKDAVAPNQVFDILPIRSALEPGDFEDVDFVFYGHANRKFKATCLCEVEGGPEYSISLVGEASTVAFKLDKQQLDFGDVLYSKSEDLELTIMNTGKVAFPFSIASSSKEVLDAHPVRGQVEAGDKQAVVVRLTPGLPLEVCEHLVLNLAHFEPIEIPAVGVGVFAHVAITLPRHEKWTRVPDVLGGTWSKCLLKTRERLRQKAGRSPPASNVEIEANRLIFLEYLRQLNSTPTARDHQAPTHLQIVANQPPPPPPAPSLKQHQQHNGKFVIAWYSCDFGNVVSGSSKKRSFKITNASISTGPLSWTFEKKALANTGFSIDPEKVVRLIEGGSVSYEVNFTAKASLPFGKRELILPIDIKNGPLAAVVLCAYVTTPEVVLSTDTLDFGAVWKGCSRTAYLQVHNVSTVMAEWELKKAIGGGSVFAEQRFRISPRSGALQPGKKCNIAIEFVPIDERAVNLKLPVKVAQSPKTWTLTLCGSGVVAKLRFEPPVVDLGPILPFDVGSRRTVALINDSDRPVHVYSVDFDPIYVEEENALLQYDGYDEDGLLRLPLDHPLPTYVPPTENAAEDNLVMSTTPQFEEDGQPAEDASANWDLNEAGIYGGISAQNSLRARGVARDVAIVAPPLSGGHQLATLIAKKHGYAVARPSQIIETLAKIKTSELGRKVRRMLGRETQGEEAQRTADAALRDEAQRAIAAARAALDDLAKTAALKKGQKGAPRQPAEDKKEEEEEEPMEEVDEDYRLFSEVIDWRRNRADAERGLVLDLSESGGIRPSILKMAKATFEQMLVVDANEEGYALRLRALDALAERSATDDLSPDELYQLNFLDHPAVESLEDIDRSVLANAREYINGFRSLEFFNSAIEVIDEVTTKIRLLTNRTASANWEDIDLELHTDEVASALAAVVEPIEPPPDPNHLALPEPETLRLICRPKPRRPLSRHRDFTICRSLEFDDSETENDPSHTRWELEPKGSVLLCVQFRSQVVGRTHTTLSFEVVGVPDQEFALPCVGICAVPTINADPRNVFMTRVKNRPAPKGQPLCKRFIMSENVYDFGPLLTRHSEHASDANSDVFRISNNSPFAEPLHVDFLVERKDEEHTNAVCRVVVEPAAMELGPGETKDLKVCAYPSMAGKQENTLLACIGQNPEPYVFKVACEGVEPAISLKGPWTADLSTESASRIVDFDRLLVGRSELRYIDLVNDSLCIVDWRIASTSTGAPAFDSCFTVDPVAGKLGIHQTTKIRIGFCSEIPIILEPTLSIEYSDADGGLNSLQYVRTVELGFKAEAYLIKAIVLDDDDEPPQPKAVSSKTSSKKGSRNGVANTVDEDTVAGRAKTQPGTLNFGQLRVGDAKQLGFTLRNKGKYNISFSFGMKRAKHADVFSVSPVKGIIEPDGSIRVAITCCSVRELKLAENKDIVCTIGEPATGESVEQFPVTVAVSAVFPKFRIQPHRGLTFGTVKYNDATKERAFELRNEGNFAFAFAVVDVELQRDDDVKKEVAHEPKSNEQLQEQLVKVLHATPRALLAKAPQRYRDLAVEAGLVPREADEDAMREWCLNARRADEIAPPSSAAVERGPFVVSPGGGLIEPGQTLAVSVSFTPEGCTTHHARLLLEVAGRDPESVEMTYDIGAESRSPGINATDLYQIFEEQAVIASLSDVHSDDDDDSLPYQGSVFAVKENLFSFGTTLLSESESTQRAVAERFKITNPNKVPAIVDFSIDESNAFTVQPASWEVPCFEHRFVTVYFHPTEMTEYRATFNAIVQDGAEAATRALSFQLAGRGALPSVSVGKTAEIAADGSLRVDFGRLQAGRSRTRQLELRNDGLLPCTALIDFTAPTEHFTCSHAGSSVSLEPKQMQRIDIRFESSYSTNPDGEALKASLVLKVLDNRYETTIVTCCGVAYENDVSIDNLPGEENDSMEEVDVLRFGMLNLAKRTKHEVSVEFELRNLCRDTVRFEWQHHSVIGFHPRVGHLPPSARRQMVATFTAGDEATSFTEELSLETVLIKLAKDATETAPWDCDIIEEREADNDIERPSSSSKKKGNKDKLPPAAPGALVKASVPEPAFETLKEKRTQLLKCVAVADRPSYACGVSSLHFAPTPMYQAQNTTFEVANNSMIELPYSWHFDRISVQADSNSSLSKPPTSARSSVAALPNPFRVEPNHGTLAPQSSVKFSVRFAPHDVDDYAYAMRCTMPALIDTAPLCISLRGRAVRPACHFDLVESADYLSRRGSNLLNEHGRRDAIEASSVRVVEVTSRGLRVQNTKRFLVTNPTAAAYDFSWEPCGQPNAAWRCLTPRGMILPGKRGEMIFEFTPTQVSISETFFRFSIKEHAINELFLFAGTVVEPRVFLDRGRVDFSAVMLGSVATETVHVVNREHVPFNYQFDKPALESVLISPSLGEALPATKWRTVKGGPTNKPTLEISPISGLVPPNGRTAVELIFRPTEEGLSNTNLTCTVRKKQMKLALNVKGEGYAVHARVVLDDETKADAELEPGETTVIDYGVVHLNRTATRTVSITNGGKFNFDYLFDRGPNPNPMFMVGKSCGTVRKGETTYIDLSFHPVSPTSLDGCVASLVIAGKFEYLLSLVGRGVAPAARFSFMQHDFGPCFLWQPGCVRVVSDVVTLRVVNHEATASLGLECTLPRNDVVHIDCGPTVLSPGEHVDISIRFLPREIKDYVFPVPFLVGGATTVTVVVKGRGVPAQLDLIDPTQARVAFGQVRQGSHVSKQLQLVNRSPRPLGFVLQFDTKVVAEHEVAIAPLAVAHLAPRATQAIQVSFAPTRRRREPFEIPVMLEYAGSVKEVCVISGRATGMEVALSTDTLAFGSVCLGSRRVRTLNLENSGDVPASFSWLGRTILPPFSISPLQGVVRPGQETAFNLAFEPSQIDADIRVDGIQLVVNSGPTLSLSCAGVCVPQPDDSKQSIDFESFARTATTKTVAIKNPTNKPWFLAPTLKQGSLTTALEHFKAAADLSILPNSETDLEITYCPLTMTTTEQVHAAELFVALPDGTAQSFKLRGKAGPPKEVTNPRLTTPAKESLAIVIPVTNWLPEQRKLRVRFEIVEGDGDATILEGAPSVEVGPAATQDYALRFFAYKEGVVEAVITFTAPDAEYVAHRVAVEVGPVSTCGTLDLEAAVRQSTRKLITVDNPMGEREITFSQNWWECDTPEVRLVRVGEMTGCPEGVFEVEYRPLVATKSTQCVDLRFRVDQLGEYRYSLRLLATPEKFQPNLRFEVPLGDRRSAQFCFKAYPCNTPTINFKCSALSGACFVVPDTVQASPIDWDGTEVLVDIDFEPSALGDVSDVVVLDGGSAGTYRCSLLGTCSRPVPKGPISCKAGAKTEIDFRNVFAKTTDFTFLIDSPAFTSLVPSATIAPRSNFKCTLAFNPSNAPSPAAHNSSGPPTAKLLVSCAEHDFCWTYYLRGIS